MLYSFSEEQILAFNKLLLSYESPIYAGNYEKEDNVIVEIDAKGRRFVRFTPTLAKDTKQAMQQLVLAYMDARDDEKVNQILLVPCVILDFLCIHPFVDGNGRMSRLLSLMLLYKKDYVIGKYISFESQINKFRYEYYEALKYSSYEWGEGNNNYFPFINNFLMTMIRCYRELDKRFDILSGENLNKKERVREAILKSLVPVSRRDIQILWPDISIDTIKKALIELQKQGIIQKIGLFKDAKYYKVQK